MPLIFGAVFLFQVLCLRASSCRVQMWLGFGEFGRLENAIVGFKGVGKAFGVGLVLVKGGMVGLKSEKGEM